MKYLLKIKCLTGLFLFFGILGCGLLTSSIAGTKNSQDYFNVGYQVFDFKYQKDGQKKKLTVAAWYPTSAKPKLHNYGGSTEGSIAVNAAPLDRGTGYPLLVFSHGYGGSGLSAVFLTQTLASHGWVVACPDHHDMDSAVRIKTGQNVGFDRLGFIERAKKITASGPDDRDQYLYRIDEMKLALDSMLEQPVLGPLINNGQIAVGGHSLGGFTALGLSGTIGNCFDPRIKAVLLFSTGAGSYLYREDELKAVKIPSMLFMGEREKRQWRGSKTMAELSDKIYESLSSPKYFLEVKGANHFSFSNSFKNNHRSKFLSGTEEQFEIIRRYSIAFLEKYVKKNDFYHVLDNGDPMLTAYDKSE